MLTEERPPVGVMRVSGTTTTTTTRVGGRIRPPWLLTVDVLPSIPAGSASPHQKPAARFALDDLVSPSSGVRRGTGAFLRCVQMQNHPPLPHPVPRPSGKPAARPPNNNTANGAGAAGSNKKKPRPSPPTTPGGPGMHAVFIEPSSSRPSGTGVFLPRSTGADQLLQHQQHPSQQQKRPPVTSSRVLLPARLFRLLNHRVLANQDAHTPPPPAAPAMINHTAGPPHHLSPPIKGGDKDKVHDMHHHQPQQNRGEGGKRGKADDAALYDHAQGDYPHNNASGTTANKKCADDDNYTASTTLIENLLPEEWSY